MEKIHFILALLAATAFLTFLAAATPAVSGAPLRLAAAEKGGRPCPPTPPDALGPFYQPEAPVRDRVGRGYVLQGVVRSAPDCAPLAGARLEFWLAGPDGHYGDDHRATLLAGKDGAYRFESNFPPGYGGRPPHIHLKVSAPGFKTLVTQHYPQAGAAQGTMDLVLSPRR
jgi:protocatechuate 3,4-dioxygenase beta subunit